MKLKIIITFTKGTWTKNKKIKKIKVEVEVPTTKKDQTIIFREKMIGRRKKTSRTN